MANPTRDIPKKKRAPPTQGGRKKPQLVRMDNGVIFAIEHWGESLQGQPPHPEAIPRLGELGLKAMN
jgi:hypothetical protein